LNIEIHALWAWSEFIGFVPHSVRNGLSAGWNFFQSFNKKGERKMKLTSFVSAAFLIFIAVGIATAQIATQEYKPPVTIEQLEVIYTVNTDGTFTQESKGQVRINTDQAVQLQAQTYLPFSETLQSLEVVEAFTDTATGERIAVPADKIITQQSPLSTIAPAFDDIRITAIVFPQISVGASKTYHYRLKQIKPLFENHFSMFEMISQSVDIEDTTITLIAPEDLKIYIQAIDVEGGQVESDTPGKSKWVWTIKDQKGQMPEPGAINETNYSPRIAVTTFADFGEVAEAYLERAADKEKVTDEVRKLAEKITAGLTSPRDQAAALYHWVAGNIRYVALSFGLGGVVPRDADTIIQSGYGDCKDKVVLLNALLTAEGIKSAPVLINSGDVYWQPDVAIPTGVYNHVITYLPEFDLFLDPTAGTAPFGILPVRERSKYALVTRGLDKGAGIRMLPEPSPTESSMETITTVVIGDDGSAKGQSIIRAKGGMEYVIRSYMASIPPGQEAIAARASLMRSGQQGEGTLSGGDPRKLDEDFKIETEFTLQNVMMLPAPGALSIPAGIPNPSPIVLLAFGTDLPERKFPRYCSGYEKGEITSVTLPDSVKITHLPKEVNVQNKYGCYKATYEQNGQTIKVERRLSVETPRGLCPPEGYPLIRELGQAIGRDMRAQILYGE
jgi:transglutaminase-like putative cysteine protease